MTNALYYDQLLQEQVPVCQFIIGVSNLFSYNDIILPIITSLVFQDTLGWVNR